jgi:hypothetical protein
MARVLDERDTTTLAPPMPILQRPSRWVPWAVGGAAGLAVVGPGLAPGSLLNLDLLVLPRFRVPPGIWGLGPELPRRVPYGVVLAWASQVTSGPFVGKAFIAVAVATAVVGASRLTAGAPAVVRLGAGLLYGLSPFLLTRIGAGHLAVVLAVAVLPWALPTLLRPGDDLARTYLAAVVLGLAGVSGGTLALAAVATGLVADRGRRWPAVAGAAVVAQLPWIVPGVVVAAGGVRFAPAARFGTRVDGVAGLLGLPAGHGFWRPSTQVGGDASVGVALLGAVVLGLAVLGASRLPAGWGRRATALASVGAALALASAVPGVRDVYAQLTRTPLLGAGRESQRWLSLFLVWLAPAAVFGAMRVGGRIVTAVPVVCALALAAPGLWGVGGRLVPVTIPSGWHGVAARVHARPGPVLALPWHQYLDLHAAGNRRVLNPMPDYLGGDVLTSSDPELGSGHQEQADPREPHATRVVDALAAGRPVSAALARLGVRWVVLLHEVDWRRYAALDADPGLRPAVRDTSADLYEVRAWRGPVVTDAGRTLPARSVVAPLARVPASGAATWQRAAAPGWLRGTAKAATTPVGTVALPSGRGVVWFFPTLIVLGAYLCTLCAALRAWRACKLKGPSVPSD